MKKILLIEDDAVLRENTAELLLLSNYSVITASNGKIGIALAIAEVPDLIVCDIMMPELDGYAVLKALSIKTRTNHIPFIYLSAKTEKKDVRKGMVLGADDYITKPFTEEDLISAIQSRLAKAAILKDQNASQDYRDCPNETTLKSIPNLKKIFIDKGKMVTYKKEEIVYHKGLQSNAIYFILKGAVKCCTLDEQGKGLTTGLYKEGDLFGFTSFAQNMPYQETARTLKEAEIVVLSKQELKNILTNNHNLTLELLEVLTDNISGIKDQLLQMAYSSVNKKTAVTILKFAEKLNNKPEDPIKISRNDLASVAGIATETLIRTLSNFKKQGLIAVEGRNIKIINLQKLQRMY